MKYQVGDLILVKKYEYKHRLPLRLRLRLHLHPRPRHCPRPHLYSYPDLLNTVGIITEVHKHSDVFRSRSTENDNLYIWLSQVDREQYYFYQDEVIGEVIK